MLRFFGYLHTVCEQREPTMKKIFCNHGVGVIVQVLRLCSRFSSSAEPRCRQSQEYAQWLETKQLKWSSIANYLAALVSAATFATIEMESPPPLDQLANLRRQVRGMGSNSRTAVAPLISKSALTYIGGENGARGDAVSQKGGQLDRLA